HTICYRDWSSDVCSSDLLVFLNAETAYLGEEGFQPERMEQAFRQAATQAVADGYRGLRAASETEWLMPAFVSPASFVEYELWVEIGRASCRERVDCAKRE